MRHLWIAFFVCFTGSQAVADDAGTIAGVFAKQWLAKQPSRSLAPNEGVLGKGRGLVLVPAAEEAAPVSVEDTTETTFVDYTHLEEDLRIEVNIRFDFDSAALREEEKAKLTAICDAMKSLDQSRVFQIVGHTDETGTDAYNARLSLLRAVEVRRSMIRDCGISGDRLQAIGVGEEYPANPDNPTADENRRVEFQAS